MHFSLILFLVTTVVSCSPGEDKYGNAYIDVNLGSTPKLSAAPLTNSAIANDTVIFADSSAKAAHQFRTEPLRLERSVPLSHGFATGGILVGKDAEYIIGLSDADISVQGRAGAIFNPVTLPGHKIASVAFDAESNIVAISDDFEAIAMIALTPEGGVTSAWLGGPLLSNAAAVGSGGFVGGGRLLTALGKGQLALIDGRASIEAAAWSYKTIKVDGLDNVDFVAALPGSKQLALVGNSSKILVLDIDAGSVLSSMPLPEGIYLYSSTLGQPHTVYAQADASIPLKVVYTDDQGSFIEKSLKANVNAGDLSQVKVEQSHLDTSRGLLTLVVSQLQMQSNSEMTTTKRVILRYRLSDSLLTDVSELLRIGDVALGPQFYFIRYPSSLGLIEKHRYGRVVDVERLEKFNLPFIKR